MGYVCRECDHFEPTGDRDSRCPECGGAMQLTMIDRSGHSAVLAPSAASFWEADELLEASRPARWAQICAGIAVFVFIRQFGTGVAGALSSMVVGTVTLQSANLAEGLAAIGVRALGGFVAGVVAGAWTCNWRLQAIGVAIGLVCIPIVELLFTRQQVSLELLLGTVIPCITAFFGAKSGHSALSPARVPAR